MFVCTITCFSLFCQGIATGGSGFDINTDDAITLTQLVISKCLDKEILCNEFYLQLIKQTTDQPGTVVYKGNLQFTLLNN